MRIYSMHLSLLVCFLKFAIMYILIQFILSKLD